MRGFTLQYQDAKSRAITKAEQISGCEYQSVNTSQCIQLSFHQHFSDCILFLPFSTPRSLITDPLVSTTWHESPDTKCRRSPSLNGNQCSSLIGSKSKVGEANHCHCVFLQLRFLSDMFFLFLQVSQERKVSHIYIYIKLYALAGDALTHSAYT